MKLSSLIVGYVFALFASCGDTGLAAMRPTVEVEMVNRSSHDLENAEVLFGAHVCRWGSVVKKTSASYMFYPHPITAQAELHWDAQGNHRVEKLDLRKIYPPGKSGRLTFTVYDDRADVTFREKSAGQ